MFHLPLRIGTRGSPLALAQTQVTIAWLAAACAELSAADAITVTAIRTTGDTVQDRTLAEIGGKGLFTREIDDAMLAGRIDLAVHSVKDLPTWLPDGIVLAALLPRGDPRDALIASAAVSLADLAPGAVIGTASLRRQAQVLHRRPDLRVVPLRGNVSTRLGRVSGGDLDATLLAAAGLARLGLADRATALLAPDEMLPAVGQAAIGITCRADDAALLHMLQAASDPATAREVAAERAMLAVLDGSCRTPIAGLARHEPAGTLALAGLLARPDGSRVITGSTCGGAAEADAIGRALGEELKARAGPGFLAW
jgi:hydroxymethylbilane synthase